MLHYTSNIDVYKSGIIKNLEPVPKLIDYALKRMVRTFGSMEQALAVFTGSCSKN
jgi:hypothetical protein